MKMIILAATVAALAAGPAFAEGNGGTIFGYDRWQGANGNPSIPSTQWFSMTPDQRQAMQHQLQQQQAGQIWGHPRVQPRLRRCTGWARGRAQLTVMG